MRRFATASLLAILMLGCATTTAPGKPAPIDLPPQGLTACSNLQPSSLDGIRDLDVVLALDSSRSTVEPCGVDIDRDGNIGTRDRVRAGNSFTVVSTDPGDSRLAAELLAAAALVHGLQGQGNRFAIVAWAGQMSSDLSVKSPDIRYTSDLTHDPQVIDASLREILRAGSLGNSNLAAPIDHGVDLLTSSTPSQRRRVILLISDAPESYPAGTFVDWRIPVDRASENSITINTFSIGEKAIKSPENLQAISDATGGTHFLIENPSELHCDLASALSSP